MIKIEKIDLTEIEGGVSCSYIAGLAFGFSAGLALSGPFAINQAAGITGMALFAAVGYLCKN